MQRVVPEMQELVQDSLVYQVVQRVVPEVQELVQDSLVNICLSGSAESCTRGAGAGAGLFSEHLFIR